MVRIRNVLALAALSFASFVWGAPNASSDPSVGPAPVATSRAPATATRADAGSGTPPGRQPPRPWVSSSVARWRSAIEGYVPSVNDHNQRALDDAKVAFAYYLDAMHVRIHPLFADWFLMSLDALPETEPMNAPSLVTRLEIVLAQDGSVKRMGIVKASGVVGFDIAALDSVDRAQPFGPTPGATLSADGNFYTHWEFHRDEVFACSTQGSRPYLLRR